MLNCLTCLPEDSSHPLNTDALEPRGAAGSDSSWPEGPRRGTQRTGHQPEHRTDAEADFYADFDVSQYLSLQKFYVWGGF